MLFIMQCHFLGSLSPVFYLPSWCMNILRLKKSKNNETLYFLISKPQWCSSHWESMFRNRTCYALSKYSIDFCWYDWSQKQLKFRVWFRLDHDRRQGQNDGSSRIKKGMLCVALSWVLDVLSIPPSRHVHLSLLTVSSLGPKQCHTYSVETELPLRPSGALAERFSRRSSMMGW